MIHHLDHVFTEAEAEFDRRAIAGEPTREVVQRAEHAIRRLIDVEPMSADEEARKNAVLSRVTAEGLFPALVGRNSETPASAFDDQDARGLR